ncbi:MAG: DUF2252 family protein, partial [Planctomycetes bacterium]|nr:DUF2252 family protein [Planctomycetota bacterium]
MERLLARGAALCSCANGECAREPPVPRTHAQGANSLATFGELDVWYSHTAVDAATEGGVDPEFAQTIRQFAAKARSRDNLQASSKLTRIVDGRRRLISDPPLLIPIYELGG